MSYCRAERRARVERAKRRLESLPAVIEAVHLPPSQDPAGKFVVDIALDSEGVPPGVLETIADHNLTLRHAQPRAAGEAWHALVTD